MKLFWITIISVSVITFFSYFTFMQITSNTPIAEASIKEEPSGEFLITSGREGVIKGFAPIGDKRSSVKGWQELPSKRDTVKGFQPLSDKRTTTKGWNTDRDSLKRSDRQK